MTPGWSFNQIDFPPLPKPTSAVSIHSRDGLSSGAWTSAQAKFTSPATLTQSRGPSPPIRRTLSRYPLLHLLGLPTEIRLEIWIYIFLVIQNRIGDTWFTPPTTLWDGLTLTCHQIWLETRDSWPRSIVARHSMEQFLSQPFNATIAHDLRLLAIEVPFGKQPVFYQRIGSALVTLASTLQDLRIFFVGKDKYGVSTFMHRHGCGARDASVESTRQSLIPFGQEHVARRPLFIALFSLCNLRSLVIRNPNYSLSQSFLIQHKPYLKYLHISTDPRTSLFKDMDINQTFVVPPQDHFPPVKILHLSSNAVMGAGQLVSKLAPRLKLLNWVMPDPSRQFGYWDFIRETAVIMRNLSHWAKNLLVLRLCIEGSLYEGHHHYGEVFGAFNNCLQLISSLELLEIHVESKSPYLGREIIRALPRSLKRFYTSEKLIPARDLEAIIMQRYFIPDSLHPCPNFNKNELLAVRKAGGKDMDDFGLVGEDVERKDYISMDTGRLTFIGYEYSANEETKMTLLRLNAQLLDRERNAGLARWNGQHSSRTIFGFANAHSWSRSRIGDSGTVGQQECYAENDDLSQWMKGIDLPDNNNYFGRENEALTYFNAENVARAENLPAPAWPEEVEVQVNQHWLSEGGCS